MNYYKDLIDSLTSEKVKSLMLKLGADNYKETDDYIIFPTICHNVDASAASMKLYYYKDSKLFYCYTKDGGMNIFKFMEHYYETRDYDYDWYDDIYSVIFSFYDPNIKKTKKYISPAEKYKTRSTPQLQTYSAGVLNVFQKYYPIEWLNDGITKEAMDKYNILFSKSRNKIIIPHYNINNELVGIRGRALNEYEVEHFGKYMPVQIESTWYSHPLSLNLYGLNITKENIRQEGYCCLFEAEKSLLQAESFKRPNCAAAVCGSNFNIYQLKLLLNTCRPKEIIICFDKEELLNEHKYFDKLFSICEKYKKYCNFSFIYDRRNLLDLKNSPTDKGEEIFNQLLNERIRVK